MGKVEEFLTSTQEKEIIEAIKMAEKNTSGEIRVHLEKTTEKPPFDRAIEVFHMLKMDQTELRNGVLFYVAIESKKFAIIGDEAINDKVPNDFWDAEKQVLLSHFSKGEFAQGLKETITKAGEKLKEFFPYQSDDINELSDEISKG